MLFKVKVIANGVEYDSKKDAMAALKITYDALQQRIRDSKWDYEEVRPYVAPPKEKHVGPRVYPESAKAKQREAMSDKEHSEETIEKMKGHKHSRQPKVVRTPIGEFESIRRAAQAHGCTPAAIYFKLKKGHEGFEYVDREPNIEWKRGGSKVPIMGPDGTIYDSIKDASDANGYYEHHLYYLLEKGIEGWKRLKPKRVYKDRDKSGKL